MNIVRNKITEIMDNNRSSITLISELKEVCSEFTEHFEFLEEPNQFYPYTCMQYCLDCTPKNENQYIAYMKFKHITHVPIIDMEFLCWLIENGFMKEAGNQNAEFIIYYVNSKPVHIGFSCGENVVISKWGYGGPLIKHRFFDAPSCYGDHIHFYSWSAGYNVVELINQFIETVYS